MWHLSSDYKLLRDTIVEKYADDGSSRQCSSQGNAKQRKNVETDDLMDKMENKCVSDLIHSRFVCVCRGRGGHLCILLDVVTHLQLHRR